MALKLGIGIITYNRRPLVNAAVRRTLAYTKMPFELVVADDGSTDGTASSLISQHVRVITGQNKGVCWNKNRSLFYLMEVAKCDVILLLEDDTYPVEIGWEQAWVNASLRYGHVGLAGHWFKEAFLSGNGAADNPIISSMISGQCVGYSREALSYVGYFDTRFKGYGVGHAEHTMRLIRSGYGGMKVAEAPTQLPSSYRYVLISSPLISSDPGEHRDEKQAERNLELLNTIGHEPVFRPGWRDDKELDILRGEMRTAQALELEDLSSQFNESCYLNCWPDVADAVERGQCVSGREHYFQFGRLEGRLPSGARRIPKEG